MGALTNVGKWVATALCWVCLLAVNVWAQTESTPGASPAGTETPPPAGQPITQPIPADIPQPEAAPAPAENAPAEPNPAAPAAEKPAPEKQLVATMHINLSGLDNRTTDGTVEMTLSKVVSELGHRAVYPQESTNFLQSEAGKPYAACTTVACTAEAGKVFGVTLVLTGSLVNEQNVVKINLQLLSTEKGGIEASFRKEIPFGAPLEEPLHEGVKDLFAQWSSGANAPPAEVAEDEETPEQRAEKEKLFYKGELTTIGPMEIMPRTDRVGVVLGYRRLGFTHYLYICPELDLRFFPEKLTKESKLRLGFGVPLNLVLFEGENKNGDDKVDGFKNAGQPRKQDWDSWRDGAKIIRYIQYGRKEDNLYLNINRMYSATIGHGLVINRYLPNLDYFTTRVSGEFDAYFDYGGVELYTNDITKANIVGALIFVKPLGFMEHWAAKSLSFGFQYYMDWDAPKVAYNQVFNPTSDGQYRYLNHDVHFIGANVELKVVKWPVDKPEVDVKVYLDYMKWLDHGQGITIGALGRFNIYSKIRQALRAKAEFRAWQDNYTPAYFDPFYEIMKFRWFSEDKDGTHIADQGTTNPNQSVTKFQELSSRKNKWNHFGMAFEFSYALLDYVGFTILYDQASGENYTTKLVGERQKIQVKGKDNGNFLFHLEVPATKYFRIVGTYYKSNFHSFVNIFDPYASNTMFTAFCRIRPVQLLALQLGVRRITQPSVRAKAEVLDAMWDLKADLDISWEF